MVTTFDDAVSNAIDDDDELLVVVPDMTPVKGCPKVDPNKRVRKVLMPDGQHWIEVRGGSSAQERLWVQKVAKKNDEMAQNDALGAYLWSARRFGTFLSGRIVNHDLVDESGDPLPRNGMELAFAVSWRELLALVSLVNSGTAIFATPKAEKTISGGIATDD